MARSSSRGFARAFVVLAAVFASPSMAAGAEVAASLAPIVEAAPVAVTLDIPAPAALPAPQQKRPLGDLVKAFVDRGDQDAEQLCLAKAVYFEARGETLEGQLAVAEVILNRAASGRYPSTICGVVTQPAQFSFIRAGKFPKVDTSGTAWQVALAVADAARNDLASQIDANVLWYHASYVAPSWGRRLTKTAQIGTHIFYS